MVITENLAQAAAKAKNYFDRICKWDGVGVTDRNSLNIFGHNISVIEEEMSQIAVFETQGIEGDIPLPHFIIVLVKFQH